MVLNFQRNSASYSPEKREQLKRLKQENDWKVDQGSSGASARSGTGLTSVESVAIVLAGLAGAFVLLLACIGAARILLPKPRADEVGFWCWASLCVAALVAFGGNGASLEVLRRFWMNAAIAKGPRHPSCLRPPRPSDRPLLLRCDSDWRTD